MAYSDQENSIQDGKPFFLYEFNTPDTTYRFIDYPTDYMWNSNIWNYNPIKHGKISQSNEMSKNSVDIVMPREGEFANLFVGWSPDFIVTLTIRRGHFGASDTLVYWKGRISSHQLKGRELTLNCESIFTSLRRAGIRARFQRNCRHAVYGPGCGLNKADWALGGVLTGVSGLTLTIPEASGEPSGWFFGGVVEFPNGTFQMVTAHNGDQVVISRRCRYLDENATPISVTLYPGCDRTLTTCKEKFDNILNNGGFKWIPQKNPLGGSSII